jgi:hypothetical protein
MLCWVMEQFGDNTKQNQKLKWQKKQKKVLKV